jgi:hypothetical protein
MDGCSDEFQGSRAVGKQFGGADLALLPYSPNPLSHAHTLFRPRRLAS